MEFERIPLKWNLLLVFIHVKLGYVRNRFEDIPTFSFIIKSIVIDFDISMLLMYGSCPMIFCVYNGDFETKSFLMTFYKRDMLKYYYYV